VAQPIRIGHNIRSQSPLPAIIMRPLGAANGAFDVVAVIDTVVCAVNWLASIVTIA